MGGCASTLLDNMCNEGFSREQNAFWAQQTGAVRQRFVALEAFGDNVTDDQSKLEEQGKPSNAPRLRSAIAFDHDQWGQTLEFDDIGEAASDWTPTAPSSVNAEISYAPRQDLQANGGTGYPLLDLVQTFQLFSGPWFDSEKASSSLRSREAIYDVKERGDLGSNKISRGNLSDVCLYPGGPGFKFVEGMCGEFKSNFQSALRDGYTSLESALRSSYESTSGLPKGGDEFNAIVHHQFEYDDFGNLAHAISPLSANKEWIERRFFYDKDPFVRTPTYTSLTRCVADIPGAGADSPVPKDSTKPVLDPDKPHDCTLGFPSLSGAVQRRAITHASTATIDPHFGVVASTKDVNGNATLLDFDRWGRFDLIARSWGNTPTEQSTYLGDLKLAVAKLEGSQGEPDIQPDVKDWRLLALANYGRLKTVDSAIPGLLRSNVRRFEPSDSYAGLLSKDNTSRETATFADGLGRTIQTIREADVCLGVADSLIDSGKNVELSADLAKRCKAVATEVVTPAAKFDALQRDLQTFESYAVPGGIAARTDSSERFTTPIAPTAASGPRKLDPVTQTTYDGAGRPLLIKSRLSEPHVDGAVTGTTQFEFRVLDKDVPIARFGALSLSPRCTASSTWSDARGLKRTIFEDQAAFYPKDAEPAFASLVSKPYQRDLSLTQPHCEPIANMAPGWFEAEKTSVNAPRGPPNPPSPQPSWVSYDYDPIEQLVHVDYPLDGQKRGDIWSRFDLMGRTVELDDPDSGCSHFDYDGLNALISVNAFKYETFKDLKDWTSKDSGCGTSSKVRNEKSYAYSGGRLVAMNYHSLEDQGGANDQRDAVRFYYDRYPHAAQFGEVLESHRLVPNDQANQRFLDATGRVCDNCVGQVSVVSDRTGARSFSYNELGLAQRETRSIIAPLRGSELIKQSEGQSETYLPEIAFFQQDNAYTSFGDLTQEHFSEGAPMNPAQVCIRGGVDTCLAQFSIGRKYAPDGALAEMLFNGKPMISAAQDDLGRPAVRWSSNGVATGYRYDPLDLRLNQMTTLTAANAAVQADGYQYDGGGNILSYANRALAANNDDSYESAFSFGYDAVNRVTSFGARARKGQSEMDAAGEDSFDQGHRFHTRDLSITGSPGAKLVRHWDYNYDNEPARGPLHAPASIGFKIGEDARDAVLGYDDLGRMTRIGSRGAEQEKRTDDQGKDHPLLALLSNRALTWDAEGRLGAVRGVVDVASAANNNLLREEYVYDSDGNRSLKIDRPTAADHPKPVEAATVYMTPFYARPFDKRGTVQLSQSNLPAASFAAPANGSDDPTATYLYSDLTNGSMTASVTSFGEPSELQVDDNRTA